MRQLFLDTETTGFGKLDRIVEIAIVEMVDRKLTGRSFHRYVNPTVPNHPDALRVHGLTDEFLAGYQTFDDIKIDLGNWVTNGDAMAPCELIAHNSRFDAGMLAKEGVHLTFTDTMAMAKAQFPKQLASLDAVAKRLGVQQREGHTHGALMDAEVLAQVYLGLTRGQHELSVDHAALISELTAYGVLADPGTVVMATSEELMANAAILEGIIAP